MALFLVPYNNAMRLGQGFNSYTQEICVDNAVVGITNRNDSQPINAVDYIGPQPTDGSKPLITTTEKKQPDELFSDLDTVVTQYPSQIVTYSSKYVEKVSDISKDMNVSGSLSIRYGEISGGGSGSYVNTNAVHSSDLNSLIQVKVINQTINVKDQLQFWPLNNGKPESYGADSNKFTKIYGDSFISGFQEGGSFSAVVSIRSLENSDKLAVTANAHVALNIGAGSVEGSADVKVAKENLAKSSEITITVNWSGGGQLKPSDAKWDIDTLQAVAARFPDLVAACPQRTHAILTKYTSLRTYLTWKGANEISPLDYDIAALYTSELLDAYMGYKAIWSEINKKLQDLDAGLIELVRAPPLKTVVRGPKVPVTDKAILDNPNTRPEDKWKDGSVIDRFEPDFAGLDLALQTCRALMVRIVVENDEVTKQPKLAVDGTRPVAYLRPQVFRTLLPTPPPAPALSTAIKLLAEQILGLTTDGDAQADVNFTGLAIAPYMVLGLYKVDLERSHDSKPQRQLVSLEARNVSPSHCQLVLSGAGGGQRYDTGVSILMVPINDEGVYAGAWDMPTQADSAAPAVPTNITVRGNVKFPVSYEDLPPKVIVWLAGFNLGGEGQINVSVKTDRVTAVGFDIVVRGSSSLKDCRVGWFAIPSDLKGIDIGSSETPWAPGLSDKAPDAQLPVVTNVAEHVRFLPKTFTRPPTIVRFITGFAFTKDQVNVRVIHKYQDVTKRGFTWTLSSWLDTKMVGASCSWIASTPPQ